MAGATLGAAQILSTPAVLVPGAPWAPDPFGTLQLIREVDSKIDPLKKEIELFNGYHGYHKLTPCTMDT